MKINFINICISYRFITIFAIAINTASGNRPSDYSITLFRYVIVSSKASSHTWFILFTNRGIIAIIMLAIKYNSKANI